MTKKAGNSKIKIIKTVSEMKVQSVCVCVCACVCVFVQTHKQQHFKDSVQRAVWIYVKPHKPPPEVVEWWFFFTQTAPPPSVHNYHNTCSYMQISAAICLSSVQCFVCKPELRGQKKMLLFCFSDVSTKQWNAVTSTVSLSAKEMTSMWIKKTWE